MIFFKKQTQAPPQQPEPPEPGDAALIAAARAGSEAMFARLIERYRPLLWRIAWRMALDADDAGDICQEIVIRIWRALPHARADRPLAPWLRVIAVREALRWLRRYRAAPQAVALETIEATLHDDPGPLGHAGGRLAAEDERRRVARALAELPPRQRSAVVLRFYEEMTLAEIAEAMECGEGSVKQHLFRAMARLRRSLKEGSLKP